MAKLLETLIDKSMEHDDSKIQEAFEGEKADNYSKAIKEGIYKQVYDEIKEEAIEEITQQALEKSKKILKKEKIKNLGSLTITGVILAFFVGLVVNETTAFIDFLKNIPNNIGWMISVGVVVLSVIVILLITVFIFIKEALQLISE